MTLADKVTSVRLILAPAFFVVYLLPGILPSEIFPTFYALPASPPVGAAWSVPILWVIFVVSEITDMLDGLIARKRAEVSDFGKLFDPFADTLTQISYFLCFIIDGILPPLLFLAVLYREFSMLFVRNLMLRKGIAQGARLGGKIKTVTYILAGALALLASSLVRLGLDGELFRYTVFAARVVFGFSVILAIVSFLDYVRVYRKL
jgi:CDP-diacylglycerol--glycerol-3-phosphate 3-phosphatidyltransferase